MRSVKNVKILNILYSGSNSLVTRNTQLSKVDLLLIGRIFTTQVYGTT